MPLLGWLIKMWSKERLKNHWSRTNKRDETLKNIRKSIKGIKHTKEHKIKISEGLKKAYEEGRRDSVLNIGKWNLGKKRTKKQNERNKELRLKYYEDHSSWNKGLTQIYRLPNKCIIHHINFNPEDNSYENLQLMPQEEHNRLHANITNLLRENKSISDNTFHMRIGIVA
jgi:hypothetical protein